MQGRRFQISKLEVSWENFGNNGSAKSLKIFSEGNQKPVVELDMFHTDEVCIDLNTCFEQSERNWQEVIAALRKKDGDDYQTAANKIETALAVAEMDEEEYQPMEVIGASTSFSSNRNCLFRINGDSSDRVAENYTRVMLFTSVFAIAIMLAGTFGMTMLGDDKKSKNSGVGLLAIGTGLVVFVALMYLFRQVVGCCEKLSTNRERATQGEMLESLDPEAGSSLRR